MSIPLFALAWFVVGISDEREFFRVYQVGVSRQLSIESRILKEFERRFARDATKAEPPDELQGRLILSESRLRTEMLINLDLKLTVLRSNFEQHRAGKATKEDIEQWKRLVVKGVNRVKCLDGQ